MLARIDKETLWRKKKLTIVIVIVSKNEKNKTLIGLQHRKHKFLFLR